MTTSSHDSRFGSLVSHTQPARASSARGPGIVELPHLPRLKPDGSTYVSDGRASPCPPTYGTRLWSQKAGQRALISLRSALVSAVAVVPPQSVARLPAGGSTTRGHLGLAPLLGFSNACRWLRAERRLSSRAHRWTPQGPRSSLRSGAPRSSAGEGLLGVARVLGIARSLGIADRNGCLPS